MPVSPGAIVQVADARVHEYRVPIPTARKDSDREVRWKQKLCAETEQRSARDCRSRRNDLRTRGIQLVQR